ncbi:putative GTP-binding protein 6 [Mesoplodon densirostris]|uniref:putative GTP-binding protein 6 n=1 Tax=Mesoplodon densirostris TaxID=48708 RepID=UPI0028DB9412|nr:putative GTP-binding protein 6 [Mesoplodon densirostris]
MVGPEALGLRGPRAPFLAEPWCGQLCSAAGGRPLAPAQALTTELGPGPLASGETAPAGVTAGSGLQLKDGEDGETPPPMSQKMGTPAQPREWGDPALWPQTLPGPYSRASGLCPGCALRRGAGLPWGLGHTLDGWSVVDTMVVPTKTPDRKLVFRRGTLERLTEKIRGSPGITAVFLNVERMAAPTKKELEAAWGVRVFDRFTVVLHIFRCNARTKEARLQVALAELPLLRSCLKNHVAHLGGRGRDSRNIMGSGESFLQVQQRLLKDKEAKIRKALDRLRRKRLLLGQQRRRQEIPVVSVVGYTNCGKTTLIKALTGDLAIQPRDQLFATLDVTAHAGWLPSRVTVIYMDTIGFLSQLPHSLVESFSATLEDVRHLTAFGTPAAALGPPSRQGLRPLEPHSDPPRQSSGFRN